jgi:hypothetical protein
VKDSIALKTHFGEVKVINMLLYYDGIRIFIGEHDKQKYLGYLVDELETEDLWLLVPISDERIISIQNKDLSIKQAIKTSELGWVHELYFPTVDSNVCKGNKINVNDIPDDYLPSDDSFITYK